MKQIGDIITLKVPKDNRDWGYNPAPDDTKCTITGFGDIAWGRVNNCGMTPGIYENRCWVNVKFLKDGIEQQACIGSFCFKEREIEDSWNAPPKKLFNLPETKFWEWDIVKPNKEILNDWGDEWQTLRIQGIQWNWKVDERGYCYMVEPIGGHRGSTYLHDSELELVKRGKVWDYYHNLPLTFKDVAEEAQLYMELGRTKEVRNPNCKLYKWTLDEALSAIKTGLGHGFYMSSFMDTDPHPDVVKYLDEDVGIRVAKFTLAGFADYLNGEKKINGKCFKQVTFK